MDPFAGATLHVAFDVPLRADGLDAEVCLIVEDGTDFVVSAKVGYPNGCLRLPSGGVLPGEPPPEAARREAWEELGLTASFTIIGRITYARPDSSAFTTWIARTYTDALGKLAPAQGELSEVRVIPLLSLLNVAKSLEILPATPHRGTTWEHWGRYRAIAHRYSHELLRAGRPSRQTRR